MQHDNHNNPKKFSWPAYKTRGIITTFDKSPKKFAHVISNITIPTLFFGINWHGPSCKNFAMPHDDESRDSKSFIRKKDMNPKPE